MAAEWTATPGEPAFPLPSTTPTPRDDAASREHDAEPTETELLDGTAPLQPEPLAQLALQRARLGADWLVRAARRDGSFYYVYDPERDEYDLRRYNEIRHAGTAYALYQAWEAVRSRDVLRVAESAAEFIRAESVPAARGLAFAYRGSMKLGGQALAIVALLERRRVLEDELYDDLITDLAECLLWLELADEPGRFNQRYKTRTRMATLKPDSLYYPGEALLALTRLESAFPGRGYLDAAMRAAEYLVHVRDGDLPAKGRAPRDDHWLAIALSELYRLQPRPEYAAVAHLQADRMMISQYGEDERRPWRIGAHKRRVVNHTSTATKGEALSAVWALAAATNDESSAQLAAASRRNAQFLMRVQYTEANTGLFPRPERAIGGWGQDAFRTMIRMDFVQHNIAQLLNVWHLTERGDLALASARRPASAVPGQATANWRPV